MHALATLSTVLALLIPAGLLAQTRPSETKKDEPRWPETILGRNFASYVKDLDSTDPSVVETALKTIPLFGPDSRDAVKKITQLLSNARDGGVRVHAAIALYMCEIRDGDLPEVVKALGKRLAGTTADTQSIVRFHAAWALGRFGNDAREAIPALIVATKDLGSWEIRRAAVTALGKAAMVIKDAKDGPDPKAVHALIAAMKDSAALVRLEATMALGAVGKINDPMLKSTILKALQDRTRDADKCIAVWAVVGIMAHEQVNDKHMNTLVGYLKDSRANVRIQAARAFGLMGKESKPKIPDLVAGLSDLEPAVVVACCWALGEIGLTLDPGDRAMAGLTALLDNKSTPAEVKAAAQEAMDKIKTGKKPEKPEK